MPKNEFHFNQVFELYKLIATPLIATIDADFYAAKRFVHYIKEFGFDGNGTMENEWGQLKTIRFKYNSTSPNGMTIENSIEIPILSLIPLPLLKVDEAVFDMDINILSEIKKENPQSTPGLLTNCQEDQKQPEPEYNESTLKAVLSPLNSKKYNEIDPILSSNLKAHIIIKQSDIPAGITKLLGAAQDACTGMAKVLRNTINIDKDNNNIILNDNCPQNVTVTLVDSNAKPIAGKYIFSKVESDDQTFRIVPEKQITDEYGKAKFTVYDAGKPLQDRNITVSFSDGTVKNICNIEIKKPQN